MIVFLPIYQAPPVIPTHTPQIFSHKISKALKFLWYINLLIQGVTLWFMLKSWWNLTLVNSSKQPVNPNRNQLWMFIGRADAEAEAPNFGHLIWRANSLEKTLMLGKIEGKRRRGWQRVRWLDGITNLMGFPGGSDGKESACNGGELSSIPGLGRSLGEGNGNAFQYFCLENSVDRGFWWATVHGVSKSQTWLND